MQEQTLTEGARRAIELAQRLAREESRLPTPGHLLWALLSEESMASERLASYGFLLDNVERDGLFSSVGSSDESKTEDDWDELLWHADSQARREGRGTDVSTEHLLSALLLVNSPVQKLLAKGGLRDESTVARPERLANPIAPNFEIQSAFAP